VTLCFCAAVQHERKPVYNQGKNKNGDGGASGSVSPSYFFNSSDLVETLNNTNGSSSGRNSSNNFVQFDNNSYQGNTVSLYPQFF